MTYSAKQQCLWFPFTFPIFSCNNVLHTNFMISQAKLSSNFTRTDFQPNQALCDFSCEAVNKELQVTWLALESHLRRTVTAYICPWRGNTNIVTQELPELVSLICFLGLLNSSWDLNLQGEKAIPGKCPLEITKSPKAIPGKSPLEITKSPISSL